MLILINRFINWWLLKLGKEKYSLSKKIKNSVKKAVKFINDFEQIAADLAIDQGYDYVVCGHIHQPAIKKHSIKNKNIIYLNSGDWVENLTSLEYHNKKWTIYQHDNNHYEEELVNDESDLSAKELFQGMLKEFKIDQE